MKRMYRVIYVVLLLVLSITGCGKSEDKNPPDTTEMTTSGEAVTGKQEESTGELRTESKGTEQTGTEALSGQITEAETEEGGTTMEAATLLYQGHASVRISTPEGKTIYVDPFMGKGYDVPADLILMTHAHYDHTKTDLIGTKSAECQTISWKESIVDGQHQNFDLGYVKVEAVEAGYNRNHNEKECVGYILTFSNGTTLYLSGDTSTTPQMSTLSGRNLDYAFFCCDGVYNMDVAEATECARLVGAKHSIPYHMVPSDNANGFDRSVAESLDVPGRIVLQPGDELVLE